jgi:hypothetical protein
MVVGGRDVVLVVLHFVVIQLNSLPLGLLVVAVLVLSHLTGFLFHLLLMFLELLFDLLDHFVVDLVGIVVFLRVLENIALFSGE